jgi:hypothetical protein
MRGLNNKSRSSVLRGSVLNLGNSLLYGERGQRIIEVSSRTMREVSHDTRRDPDSR